MVIIVFGLPGSGKSYLASRLAKQLDAVYVNSDEVRLKMFSQRTYTDAEKGLVYEAMAVTMTEALSHKKPVILDATFYKTSLRNKFERVADTFREKIIYIEVTAPEKSIEERLKKTRKNSEATWDVYQKLKATFEPLLEEHLVLTSSDQNISTLLREAIHYINTRK
jgi:predicted kinase